RARTEGQYITKLVCDVVHTAHLFQTSAEQKPNSSTYRWLKIIASSVKGEIDAAAAEPMVRRLSPEEQGFKVWSHLQREQHTPSCPWQMSLGRLPSTIFPASVQTIKPPRRTAVMGEFLGLRASDGDALERVLRRHVAGSHLVHGEIALEI